MVTGKWLYLYFLRKNSATVLLDTLTPCFPSSDLTTGIITLWSVDSGIKPCL